MSLPLPSPRAIESPWLTAKEAVLYLKLPTVRALYQQVRRGMFKPHRLGKRELRFHRAELDAALMKR